VISSPHLPPRGSSATSTPIGASHTILTSTSGHHVSRGNANPVGTGCMVSRSAGIAAGARRTASHTRKAPAATHTIAIATSATAQMPAG
jgi:hypothetical protein